MCRSTESLTITSITKFEVSSQLLAQTEGIQDTSVYQECVSLSVEVTSNTSTQIGDEVPDTVLVVATEHIAQVEQNVLVNSEILVNITIESLTHPNTGSLSTKSETWSKPLTNSQ